MSNELEVVNLQIPYVRLSAYKELETKAAQLLAENHQLKEEINSLKKEIVYLENKVEFFKESRNFFMEAIDAPRKLASARHYIWRLKELGIYSEQEAGQVWVILGDKGIELAGGVYDASVLKEKYSDYIDPTDPVEYQRQ